MNLKREREGGGEWSKYNLYIPISLGQEEGNKIKPAKKCNWDNSWMISQNFYPCKELNYRYWAKEWIRYLVPSGVRMTRFLSKGRMLSLPFLFWFSAFVATDKACKFALSYSFITLFFYQLILLSFYLVLLIISPFLTNSFAFFLTHSFSSFLHSFCALPYLIFLSYCLFLSLNYLSSSQIYIFRVFNAWPLLITPFYNEKIV